MPNIFDNITDDTRLGPALQESLRDFDYIDCATGYLDLRGWSSSPTSSTANQPQNPVPDQQPECWSGWSPAR